MAANNDFNLVISDEEGGNPMSGRTQNTLSQHGSPAGQFTRQPHGDMYSQQYSYKNMTSPQSHEHGPSGYEQDYGAYHSDGQGPYYSEDGTTHKTTSEYYSTVQQTSNSQGSTKAQFKKSKRQPNESQASEEEYQQQALYGGTFSANSFQNDPQAREYLNRMAQGGNDRYAEGSFQNDPQGREYQGRAPNERYAEEYEYDEEQYQGEDPRSQSLRDSQLGGPVRYSKMSEEEAARAFENRRKELFSTYLKKGPKKAPGQKGLSAGNEAQAGNIRDIPSPEEYGKGVGFVIYNDKSPTSSQPPSAQGKGQSLTDISSKGQNLRRKPSIERRESPINTVKLAKQRKDSPSNRGGSRPGSQRQTPRSQKPATPSQSKPVANKQTPRDGQPSKVTVDYKRQSGSKRNDEWSGNQYENIATNESRQTQNRTVNVSHKNEQEYYGNSNPYLANKMEKKNKDILMDIHNLDEEIYRLESESTRKSQAANESKQGYTQLEYMQQFEANAGQNGQPQNRNSKQGWDNDGRRTGPRASEKENSYDKKYQAGQNVKEQREKRQRINELTAEKGMRYTDTSQQGSVKEQLQQSYMVLNEKGFEQHSDYLYERALVKMKSRDTIAEKTKEAKEKEEMLQCTFSPQIKTKGDPRIEDIVTKTRNWQVERDRQMLVNERNKVEKELRECTFYPNGAIDKEVNADFNPNGFYKRNIEWIKRKEAENKRRENEQYKSIMTVPEKSRSQANLSFSRVNESQTVYDRLASPMGSTRGGGGGRLQRTPSNRSLRSARNEQRTGSEKRVGSARTTSKKRDDSVEKKTRGSYKRTTTQPNSAKKEEKKSLTTKTEKTFDTQESVDNKKEVNMQSQILESYAILDGLQHLLHSKEKEKQENISSQKQGVTNKLKTISVPSKTVPTKPDFKSQTAKSRYNPSPARSQPRLSAKLPVTSPGYQPIDTEEKMQSITVKKNRYYIEEKPMERRNSRTSYREQSATKDAKKRQATPSKEYALTKYNKEGSYAAAANQAKKRGESPYKPKRESPFKPKPAASNYDASASKISHSDAMVSPFHSGMASPQAYGLFGFTPSPRNQMNFVSKGLTSPNATAPNLEKKYLNLLDQVSRVTKQLDHVSAENSSLQQDISSMQKRQMNKNMLYSQ